MKIKIRAISAGAVALSLAVFMTACSSDTQALASSSSSESGLPKTIALQGVLDLTGVAGASGVAQQKGMQVAISQINKTHFLGSTKLSLKIQDDASQTNIASNLFSQIVASNSPVVFGSGSSAEALAQAPIGQSAGVPTLFSQAASTIASAGNYVFHTTPVQLDFFPLTLQYLKDKNIKTVTGIYDTDNPTTTSLFGIMTSSAKKFGYKVLAPQTSVSTQTDISPQITAMVNSHAQAVFVDGLATHNVQIIKQLKAAGYKGLIIGQQGEGGGYLNPLGKLANGVTFANDFNPGSKNGTAPTFVKLYKAKYGVAPLNFSAEGYDSVWYAARGIKKANSVSRSAVRNALVTVGKKGFTGALGDITYDSARQEIVSGAVLVVLKNNVETLVQPQPKMPSK
jgi:branched-chain amino acid transport system substrate-binding protein